MKRPEINIKLAVEKLLIDITNVNLEGEKIPSNNQNLS